MEDTNRAIKDAESELLGMLGDLTFADSDAESEIGHLIKVLRGKTYG